MPSAPNRERTLCEVVVAAWTGGGHGLRTRPVSVASICAGALGFTLVRVFSIALLLSYRGHQRRGVPDHDARAALARSRRLTARGAARQSERCEHTFVGNAGSPQGRLRRALVVGDPLIAITAASDVERLVLDDAFALAVLLLRGRDPRASRAAARAAGRFALEQRRVDLDELALVLAGLEGMLGGANAPLGLRLALERRGLRAAREQLDR